MTNPITEAVARRVFERRYDGPISEESDFDGSNPGGAAELMAVERGVREDVWEEERDHWITLAELSISAHLKALEEAGYVVVPREPTEAIRRADG